MTYKGIVLAGGMATRLSPVSNYVSKQLLPIYDKPLIYYPISVLMLAGIKDILIIVNKNHKNFFYNLLGDGSNLGIKISYEIQDKPNGIAESFLIAEKFLKHSNVALILGDNIFYGRNLIKQLSIAKKKSKGATIFTCHLKNPNQFGVVRFDNNNKPISIVEKPKKYISNQVVTGLYFYDNQIVDIAKTLKPSPRNELEITDVNNIYIKENQLEIIDLGRGFTWFDTGTFDKMLEASNFVKTIEDTHGLKISCLEEIAFQNNWVDKKKLLDIIRDIKNKNYKAYLKSIIK